MRRWAAALVLGALLWLATVVSSLYVEPMPDCYLSATWRNGVWDYGRQVCFDPELSWLEMDADILARVALEEDPSAAASVMWVVINRADGGLLETVATPGAFHGLRERTPLRTPWDRRQWDRLQAIAWDVLLGLQADPTGGATHFHRTGTWTPPWAPQEAQWVSRGAHVFYRGA